jgi:hypothetical protein
LRPLRAEQSRLHAVELAELSNIAADANKNANEAQERTEAAKERITELQLTIEQIKHRRTLSNEQKELLKASLKDSVPRLSGKLSVSSVIGDEAEMYASEFITFFADLGINVQNTSRQNPREIRELIRHDKDLVVIIKNDDATDLRDILVTALVAAGLRPDTEMQRDLQWGDVALAVLAKR